MAIVGYARTSTKEQQLSPQVEALVDAGVSTKRIYVDKGISGRKTDRDGLRRCLRYLKAGDMLVVWKADRLGRDERHLNATYDNLVKRGIRFRSLIDGIDSDQQGGALLFRYAAHLAEVEYWAARQRTLVGLASAQAKGHRGGRPQSLNPERRHDVLRLFAEGKSKAAIARQVGTSRGTVYRVIEAASMSAA